MAEKKSMVSRATSTVKEFWQTVWPYHYVRPPVDTGTEQRPVLIDSPYSPELLASENKDYAPMLELHSWVLACVRAISHAVSTVPMKAQKWSNGKWEELGSDIFEVKTLMDVNDYMSQQDLNEWTASFLALQGKAYWELARDGKGRIAKIYTMHPSYTTPIPGGPGEYIKGYKYWAPATPPRYFKPTDVMFFKFFHPHNDYDGLSPITAVQEGILSDFYAQRYNKNFFLNDATPRGVLETDRGLSKRAVERLRGVWRSLYGGFAQAHGTAILEEGLKYRQIPITPRDMEFLRLRKFTREEIMAVFGVYPVVLGLMEGSTYANAAAQKQLFYEHTISLYIAKIQSQLTFMLQRELHNPYVRVIFDLSEVPALRPAVAEVVNWGSVATNAGILTINEVRSIIGRKPVPWGDTWFGNQATVPIADASGEIAPNPNSEVGRGETQRGLYSQMLKEAMGDVVDFHQRKARNELMSEMQTTLQLLQARVQNQS